MRVARRVTIDAQQRETLQAWAEEGKSSAAVALRARIILEADRGRTNKQIAADLGTDRRTVARWRQRFLDLGIEGLRHNAPRVHKTPAPRDVLAPLILETTLNVPPPVAKHWSTRTLAATLGVSRSMVDRVWRSNGINPRYIAYHTNGSSLREPPGSGAPMAG